MSALSLGGPLARHDLGDLEAGVSGLECDPNEHQGNKDGFDWFH
jgi:hypothetical protein